MINSERGYEYIVLYAFVMSNALIFQKVFMPGTALRLRMPQFRLVTK